MVRYHFRFCKFNPSGSLPIIVSHRNELYLFLFDFYIKNINDHSAITKRSKSTQLKKANFVTKLFSNCHNCFLYWRKLKLPKIFKINKTPKSTFCHVTSQTPTQLCPCIKVLLAFESSSMRIDSTYAHFWRPRKGPKRN